MYRLDWFLRAGLGPMLAVIMLRTGKKVIPNSICREGFPGPRGRQTHNIYDSAKIVPAKTEISEHRHG
jgi:hypothetical protein